MQTSNPEELFERLLDAFVPTIVEGGRGGGRWPMPVFPYSSTVGFYAFPFVVREFMNATDALLNTGASLSDIGKKYRYPSKLARLVHTFFGRPLWFLSLEGQQKVAYRLASILATLYKRKLFCKDGKNIIYTNDEIRKKYAHCIQKPSRLSTQNTERVSSLLFLLAETFSPRYVNLFFEFSGPYECERRFIVLKEFHDLKPSYLPYSVDYPFQQLTIVEVYDTPVDYRVDIMCRATASNQNLPRPTQSFVLFESRTPVEEELEEASRATLHTLEKSTAYLQSLDTKEKMVEFNAAIEAYAFLYPLMGEKAFSFVPEALKNFVDSVFQEKVEKVIAWRKSLGENEAGIRKLFDVHIDPHLT